MPKSSQLQMRRTRLDDLPHYALEFGYLLRTCRPGDDEVWCEVTLGHTYDGWNAERVRSQLLTAPQFDPCGLFFVTIGSRAAGTAIAWHSDLHNRKTGELRLLIVRKEHRGKGLGKFLGMKALQYFRDKGFSEVVARIDADRLPAIRTYLALGFEPVYAADGDPERWAKVLRRVERQAARA
jgi:mycothiol synthase